MQNNNHKSDFTCSYGETLVAILYGEAAEAETAEFDFHLARCGECLKELAAFGIVREAVTDWRETNFTPLELPEIVLPIQNQIAVVGQKGRSSRLESVRAFFTPFNFNWQMTAAGFAVFVLLGFFIIGSTDLFKKPTDVAVAPSENSKLKPEINSVPNVHSPPNQTLRAQTTAESTEPSQTAASREEKNSARPVRPNSKTTKGSDLPRAKNNNLPKRSTRAPSMNQTSDDLSILPGEADDNSLRLTDLFEEIEPSS